MRIKKRKVVTLIIGLLLCVLTYGCGKSGKPYEGEPSDYFPTNVGTRWIYKIEIGEVAPLNHWVIRWPSGNGRVIDVGATGVFRGYSNDKAHKTFMLEMSAKGPTPKQGPVDYAKGVELEIEKDELGIFEGAKKVFWAIQPDDNFIIFEVVACSPFPPNITPCPWGVFSQEDGFSTRPVYFDDRRGTRRGVTLRNGEEPEDKLLFTGNDTQVPQYEGIPLRHFLRTVEPATTEGGFYSEGISEDTWFAKGKGLVRLEQKVDGEVSMVWTLVEFSE